MYRVPSQQRRNISKIKEERYCCLFLGLQAINEQENTGAIVCVCVALERSCAPTLRASGRVWERRHDEPLTHTNSANFRSFPSILLAHVPPPTSFSSHRNPAAAKKKHRCRIAFRHERRQESATESFECFSARFGWGIHSI